MFRNQTLPAFSPAAQSAERLFALSQDLLCLVADDGHFRRVNPAFERTLGWTSEELLARPVLEFVHPDDRAATHDVIAQLASGIAVATVENRYVCRDGSYRWLSWHATTADEHGFLYAVGRDVSDLKRADAALRESEQRHRALFEQSPLGMVVFDAAGHPVECNPAFVRMWGVDVTAMPPGYSVFSDPQLVRWGVVPAITRAFAGERVQLPPLSYDMGALVGAPGRATWTQVNAYPIHDETGTVAKVVVLHEDITARIAAESERRVAEERFRFVQDASLDSFALWDAVRSPDGAIEDFVLAYANAVWERSFGRTLDEVRGRRLLEFFPTAKTSGRFDGYVRVLETGLAEDSVVDYEVDDRSFRISSVKVGEGIGITITDITVRVQAEQVLHRSREELEQLVAERTQASRESEERFRSLTEHSSDAISILDVDGTISYGSQAYERVFGYQLDTLIGSNVFDLLHADDRVEVIAVFQRLVERPEEIQTAEFRIRRGDGAEVWVHSTGQNRLADPAVRGIVINSRDVTAQRIAADVSRRAEAMFRGLAQQSITGAYIGQDGRVVYGNPRFAEIFGYSVEELHALPGLLDLIAPEARANVAQMLRHRVEGRGDVQYTTLGLRKDGTRVPVEVYGSSVEMNGRPAVVATVLDIRERVRAEAALRESEERFRITFEQSGTGVCLCSTDGRFAKVNPALCALLGYDEEELLAMSFQGLTHPDDLAASALAAQRIIAGDLPDGHHAAKRYLRKSGEVVWVLLTVTLCRDESGQPQYFIAQMQDITARKQAEMELAASEVRYRQLFECNPKPAWVYDRETLRFLAVNPAAVEHYGHTAEEFLALPVTAVFLAEDRDAVEAAILEVGRGHVPPRNWRHVTRDGRVLEVVVTSHPLEYEGRPARQVLVDDVTERRRMELALAASEVVARESEARFRVALDGMLDAFFVLREKHDAGVISDFTVVEANTAGAAMLGTALDDLPGLGLLELLPLTHESGLFELLRRAAEQGERYEGEYQTRDPRTAAAWLRLQVIPMPDGVAVTARDITDIKRADVALRELAVRDDLTGLLNRRGLREMAAQEQRVARRQARRDALLCLDLTGFKHINDDYGHAEGDRALGAVARVLSATVRDGDLVARVGGDEFVVYAAGLAVPDESQRLAARLRAALDEDNARQTAAGRPYVVRTGIGVAELAVGEGLDEALARGDAALYADKLGRGDA